MVTLIFVLLHNCHSLYAETILWGAKPLLGVAQPIANGWSEPINLWHNCLRTKEAQRLKVMQTFASAFSHRGMYRLTFEQFYGTLTGMFYDGIVKLLKSTSLRSRKWGSVVIARTGAVICFPPSLFDHKLVTPYPSISPCRNWLCLNLVTHGMLKCMFVRVKTASNTTVYIYLYGLTPGKPRAASGSQDRTGARFASSHPRGLSP